MQHLYAQRTAADTLTKEKRYSPTPQKASMLAAVLPGMGQIYNRKYWKLPIVYAGFAGLGYAVTYNTSHYNRYIKAFQDFTDEIPQTASYLDIVPWDPKDYDPVLHPDTYDESMEENLKEAIRVKITQYRQDRDLSYIGIAAWYALSILDANVDASLFDFNIDRNLNITILPLPVNNGYYTVAGINVGLNLNF